MVSKGSNNKNIIEAVGLTKVFSDFWFRAKARAVDGIDFTIEQNEIFGLLGPNGSGKSTTIKMILGLLRKSRGRLAVFGKDPSDVSIKSRIGYLPEETYMYRFLDARETLNYYGKLFGLDRRIRKKRVEELLDMVGLSQVAHRKVGEYSKGMARRIGLAQALINDPDLLILDEPTSGLDPIGTRQVKGLLEELGRKGTTILLSSHLLSDVEDVCDRMVILYGGKIRAEGTADELLSDSEHTVIRVPHIDTKTLAAVEKTLKETAGVTVESVESPRQRLEDFFLDIVESARAEQISNAGAGKSGPTAAFLSRESQEGDALIENLSSEAVDAPAPIGVEKQSAAVRKENEDHVAKDEVLEQLLQNKESAKEVSQDVVQNSIPETSADVDLGMIDGLLDDSDGDGKGGKG
jgi:ABC-2 type transport system ATP-binding protein